MAKKSSYVIRGGAEGRERLRMLSRIQRQATLNLLERAGIRRGMACLDVGCGGGDVSFDLARLVGADGRVVAVDFDEVKIGMARNEATDLQLTNIEFAVVDIGESDLPAGFDLVFARFVLSHLRNPERALKKMWKALRPGGVAVITDTDFSGYFSEPDSPALKRHVDLYTKTLARRGEDANLGPRLPALLAQSGFEAIRMSVVQHAGTEGEVKLITPMTMEYSGDAIIAEGLASPAEVEKITAELYEFARDPNTVLSGPRLIETLSHRPAA